MTYTDLLITLQTYLQGTHTHNFRLWFTTHETEIKPLLNRSEFLALKFKPFDFAQTLLHRENLAFQVNVNALNKQKFLFEMPETVLTTTGDLDFAKFCLLYDALPALFFANNPIAYDKKVTKLLAEMQPQFDYISQEMQEFLFFLEITALLFKDFSTATIHIIETYFSKNVYFTEIDIAKQRILAT